MKLCECGCGLPAPLSKLNERRRGYVKGQPMRFIHGHRAFKHRMGRTPEWQAWADAKQRCTNPKIEYFADYGGRGIKFLFTSFEQFFAEIGPRPAGMSLDRIDNDGNYEPGNVRWATASEQRKNQRPLKNMPVSPAEMRIAL